MVFGLVNLLVLGGLLVQQEGEVNTFRPGAPLFVAGWLTFSTVLFAALSVAGARWARRDTGLGSSRRWLASFAQLAAAGVLFLILVGGAVTSAEAGMAAPDWPTTMGANMFLFPLSRMTGGLFYEHAHRLIGALVGLTTLVLTVWTLARDNRRWVKWVAALAFVFVCLQGWLGGGRVQLDARVLAFVHGVTGQLFFALMAALAALHSRAWAEGSPPVPSARTGSLRITSSVLLIAFFIQLMLGAAARHFTKDGAPHMHTLITHASFAVVVVVLAGLVGLRMKSMAGREMPGLRRVGAALFHTAGLQIGLGVATLWAVLAHQGDDPTVELLLATAHQTVGALLLGLATLCAVWARRAFTPSSSALAA